MKNTDSLIRLDMKKHISLTSVIVLLPILLTIIACNPSTSLQIQSIDITPKEVVIGENVEITVQVANSNKSPAVYDVTLIIDNETNQTKPVTVWSEPLKLDILG